jgi:2-polyprenyl-3-methyl-5-hydroxy-6-metoxy-1,4-benzoquinol methylase
MLSTSLPRQADIAFQANLYEDPNPTRRGLHRARREWVQLALASRLMPGGRVLEVGIGCGIFTRFLSQIGAKITAVDINPAFVLGVSEVAEVTPVLADATTDLMLGEHELVLCSEVLEHVPPSQSLAMLKTLRRGLTPDGRLILTTPQSFSTVELMARLLKFPPILALARKLYGTADELGHINLLTSRQLRRQLASVGFEIEEECLLGFYLPVVAEFGGGNGARLLTVLENIIARVPVLRGLLWTQAYVLKRARPKG